MLFSRGENAQSRSVGSIPACFGIELFSEAAHVLWFVIDDWEHSAKKDQVTRLECLHIGAEWRGDGWKLNAKILQPEICTYDDFSCHTLLLIPANTPDERSFLSQRSFVIPGRGRAIRSYVLSHRSMIGANNVENFSHTLEKRRFTVRSRGRPLCKGHDLRFIHPLADLPTSAGTKHTLLWTVRTVVVSNVLISSKYRDPGWHNMTPALRRSGIGWGNIETGPPLYLILQIYKCSSSLEVPNSISCCLVARLSAERMFSLVSGRSASGTLSASPVANFSMSLSKASTMDLCFPLRPVGTFAICTA